MKEVDFYSGLGAGLISSFVCNPLDVIRVNKQTLNKIEYTPRFLSRGLFASSLTIPSFWSIYFYSYNKLKTHNTFFSVLNGYIASNIATTITCPLWFIRQKHQTMNNFNTFKFYKNNGIKPFYNALISTYVINASFIIQMPVYEKLKTNDKLKTIIVNDTGRIFLITSISKTIAACVFYPIDTIRAIKRDKFKLSVYDIIKKLNKNPKQYYFGLGVYLLRSIPYHTTTFCTFEYIKKKLIN